MREAVALATLGVLLAGLCLVMSPWPWTAGLPAATLLLYFGLGFDDAQTPE